MPQLTAGKAFDKLINDSCGPKVVNHPSTERKKFSRARNKVRTEVVSVACRCRVREDEENMNEEDEEDELIWWSWDGKLTGFSDC